MYTPYAGFEELPEGSLPRHEGFRLFRSASMHDLNNWGDWIRAYRRTLPTVMLPAVLAESYAVASALAGVHADGLRVVAWNHSDNPYDYAYLSHHEPIIHRYVVNTHACEQALLQRVGTRHRDIVLIPHGVSIGPETTRDAHMDRPIRIAYGGRFDHLVKRVLDFPKLAMRLFEAGVRFELLLAGDGPQREQLESAVNSTLQTIRAGGSNIRIEPPRPPHKMPLIWQWADVAMLMSVHEGMSVAMLEAMAEGCVPVVTAVKSGARDVLQSGRNGFTFPIGDIDEAANIIAKLAREPATLILLSTAARETIATQHGFSTHVDRFMALLNEVEQSEPRFGRNAATLQINAPGVTDPGDSLTVPSDAAAKLMALLQRISNEASGPI
ncbi:MAG: glycosyltransferase family 4 protein [Planctomycetes bacterium]|nr:glycosyltransferase family 4 protein [Planctomycetota bacterium]